MVAHMWVALGVDASAVRAVMKKELLGFARVPYFAAMFAAAGYPVQDNGTVSDHAAPWRLRYCTRHAPTPFRLQTALVAVTIRAKGVSMDSQILGCLGWFQVAAQALVLIAATDGACS